MDARQRGKHPEGSKKEKGEMKFRGKPPTEEDTAHFVEHVQSIRRSLYHIAPETDKEKQLLESAHRIAISLEATVISLFPVSKKINVIIKGREIA